MENSVALQNAFNLLDSSLPWQLSNDPTNLYIAAIAFFRDSSDPFQA
jgi:hypothetical protein